MIDRSATMIGYCFSLVFCPNFSHEMQGLMEEVFLQDGSVIIWRKQFGEEGEGINNIYTPQKLCQFEDVVWHVSWSFTGNILAVSGGDNEVSTAIVI